MDGCVVFSGEEGVYRIANSRERFGVLTFVREDAEAIQHADELHEIDATHH
jgi:hypothetical protein